MLTRWQVAMRGAIRFAQATLTLMAFTGIVVAQAADGEKPNPSAPEATERANPQPIVMSHFRPHDARGLNVFEPPKIEGVAYNGFQLVWGAAFTQQFQALDHENAATPVIVSGVNTNQLINVGSGFNNANANLFLDAQVGRGLRVALTTYLSSRHHPEAWAKDGYLLVDGSPWENETLDQLMKYLTLRIGHFEINYGDMHYRRSDNGQTIYNPLVGNLLMDAFTTEVGGEAYVRKGDLLGMIAVTGGEVRGQTLRPEARAPSVIAKLGFDREVNDDTRVRLTGSLYTTKRSINNTLYTGSRAGSRYYYVLQNTAATEAAQAWSGDVPPGFRDKVTAWVVNPFVRYRGLELFGNIEQAKGRNSNETVERKFTQFMGEGLYRMLDNRVYVAARYNTVKGRLAGMTSDVSVDRISAGGGLFLTPNMLMKLEYVQQKHKDYPANNILHDGKFDGFVVEAALSF